MRLSCVWCGGRCWRAGSGANSGLALPRSSGARSPSWQWHTRTPTGVCACACARAYMRAYVGSQGAPATSPARGGVWRLALAPSLPCQPCSPRKPLCMFVTRPPLRTTDLVCRRALPPPLPPPQQHPAGGVRVGEPGQAQGPEVQQPMGGRPARRRLQVRHGRQHFLPAVLRNQGRHRAHEAA
jgi:hypothetical protein